MSTTDEARAEAERDLDEYLTERFTPSGREQLMGMLADAGYRKPEAAPSDTDEEAWDKAFPKADGDVLGISNLPSPWDAFVAGRAASTSQPVLSDTDEPTEREKVLDEVFTNHADQGWDVAIADDPVKGVSIDVQPAPSDTDLKKWVVDKLYDSGAYSHRIPEYQADEIHELADEILSRTSQPVQVEVTEASVTVLAKHMANAASDWNHNDCGDEDHPLEHSNWEAYTDDARRALVTALAAGFSRSPQPSTEHRPGDEIDGTTYCSCGQGDYGSEGHPPQPSTVTEAQQLDAAYNAIHDVECTCGYAGEHDEKTVEHRRNLARAALEAARLTPAAPQRNAICAECGCVGYHAINCPAARLTPAQPEQVTEYQPCVTDANGECTRWSHDHTAASQSEAAPSCLTCRHAAHEGYQCLNMASDDECSCDKRPATAAPSDTDRKLLLKEAGAWTPELIAQHVLSAHDTIRRLADALSQPVQPEAAPSDTDIPTPESVEYAEFEEWEQAMWIHQPVLSIHHGGIVGCQCLDRVFVKDKEDWGSHLASIITARLRTSQPVQSPSDTDREALIDLRLATDTLRMSDGYNSVIVRGNEEAADLVIAAGFSRSQPVRVEVTNELVNRLLFKYDNDPNFGVREFRSALSAALGGGDHAE